MGGRIVSMPPCPNCKGMFTRCCDLDTGEPLGICRSCGACFSLVLSGGELVLKSDKWPCDPVWC